MNWHLGSVLMMHSFGWLYVLNDANVAHICPLTVKHIQFDDEIKCNVFDVIKNWNKGWAMLSVAVFLSHGQANLKQTFKISQKRKSEKGAFASTGLEGIN